VVSGTTVHVYEPKIKVDLTKHVVQHEFMFDSAFNEDSSNNDVFQRTAKPLVEFVVAGGKVTAKHAPRGHPLTPSFQASCFAFGQTGSGKTHTMMGHRDEKGLYLLAAQHLFNTLRAQGLQLQVGAARWSGRESHK
jgi:kinesin family protein 2/24